MTAEERKRKALDFINSSKFGIDTFRTIFLFRLNANIIISTLVLYGHLIDKLESSGLLIEPDKIDIIRIKQQITLDSIMKIEILIESLLVLVHSLSKEYRYVAPLMTHYDNNLIKAIIQRNKERWYNGQKILGLPTIDRLPLNRDEKKFLVRDFSYANKLFIDRLSSLINFYEKFKIIYGKSKHGLSIQSGTFTKGDEKPDFLNSALFVYDTKRESDMPSGYLISKDIRFDPISYGSNAFNVSSHLNFNRQLVDEINKVLSILKDCINFICDTHLIKAINCDKNYLPYRKKEDRISILTFLTDISEADKSLLKSISDKILPNMNTQEINFTINCDMTSPEIIHSMTNDTVTNVLLKFQTINDNVLPRKEKKY